ncbi:hypothetical protein C922_03297 [Plasmodium inui San Antonio 1]|uniref:Uncharacterized protein n=1 Tax=Plasmodium inui San Antonio 1 TaxID=1237626 RepID=W7AM22_9APIC|nr:hypothetical protein C922_03297 [Plasmodium inui San Antonio 1]EUD66381.1 hypothetical protein C922_03297 [Plasmodium inui San Antonio 1]
MSYARLVNHEPWNYVEYSAANYPRIKTPDDRNDYALTESPYSLNNVIYKKGEDFSKLKNYSCFPFDDNHQRNKNKINPIYVSKTIQKTIIPMCKIKVTGNIQEKTQLP